MTRDCPFDSRLDTYHDGELDAESRRAVERHLDACPACAAQLVQIRGMSQLLDHYHPEPLSEDALAAVHEAVDAAGTSGATDRSSVLRIAGFLLAAAASILVVSGAWLVETPQAAAAHRFTVSSKNTPDWEYVAMGLPTAPLEAGDPGETRLAAAGDVGLADWMVHQLQARGDGLPW